jgi:tRNA threonylcarbamoyladenosine biosynthesis protein TsaB
MPYLAIDTSTQTLTVAIGDENQLLAEASVAVKKNHSNRLMPLIENLFESLDLEPSFLKGIVAGHGPGSYTGVRIGVTTGKLMAWSLRLPITGVSSLNGLAAHYREEHILVCPMIDARRKQAYCALYENRTPNSGTEARNAQHKMEPDALRKLDVLFPLIKNKLQERAEKGLPTQVMFLGDGAENYKVLIQEYFGEQALFPEDNSRKQVRAAYLLEEGIRKIRAGETVDVERFVPEYLQLVEAEAKLLGLQDQATSARESV